VNEPQLNLKIGKIGTSAECSRPCYVTYILCVLCTDVLYSTQAVCSLWISQSHCSAGPCWTVTSPFDGKRACRCGTISQYSVAYGFAWSIHGYTNINPQFNTIILWIPSLPPPITAIRDGTKFTVSTLKFLNFRLIADDIQQTALFEFSTSPSLFHYCVSCHS